MGMVAASFALTLHLTPKLFVDDESLLAQRYGATAALDVVAAGGIPLYILGAIPYFLLMIAGEYLLSLACKLPCAGGRYDFSDTWSSITAGITQQFGTVLVCPNLSYGVLHLLPVILYLLPNECSPHPGGRGAGQIKNPLKLGIVPYSYVYYTYGVPNKLTVSVESGWTWLACFVMVDCGYYWLHRWCHELGFMWAGHSVHHSSEHYNLSTALRQSWWQAVLAPAVYLPLALFFPPALYAALEQANIVYQFWVHTCLVRRLPWPVELVFMTPSHHRVHHDRRVHKNFGGVFIVWDRLFGSFLDENDALAQLGEDNAERAAALGPDARVEERAEEVLLFGIMPVVRSYTESVAQMQLWSPIFRPLRDGKFRAALSAAWFGPGYYTAGAPRCLKPPSAAAVRLRLPASASLAALRYVGAHFAATIALGFGVLLAKHAPLFSVRVPLACYCLASLYAQGLLLDSRQQGEVAFERARLRASLAGAVLAIALPVALPEALSAAVSTAAFRCACSDPAIWPAPTCRRLVLLSLPLCALVNAMHARQATHLCLAAAARQLSSWSYALQPHSACSQTRIGLALQPGRHKLLQARQGKGRRRQPQRWGHRFCSGAQQRVMMREENRSVCR